MVLMHNGHLEVDHTRPDMVNEVLPEINQQHNPWFCDLREIEGGGLPTRRVFKPNVGWNER